MGAALHRNFPQVDFVVRGEGEHAFVELLDALGGHNSLRDVAGLCWRDTSNAQIANNERVDPCPIADVPAPDYNSYFNRLEISSLKAQLDPKIAGRLGLLLAVPPGYATAVFVPAGIAVAGMFMAGAATLPGTFLGSFLLNIWTGYAIAHRFELSGIAVALVIAAASTLQAAVGGAVLRRVIGYPATFGTTRDLLLFLALSSMPVLAATSACTYQLGFKALHDLIPQIVGDCTEDEHHNPANGDGLQQTTATQTPNFGAHTVQLVD